MLFLKEMPALAVKSSELPCLTVKPGEAFP